MQGVQLSYGDAVLWLDQNGFAHAGIVVDQVDPYVIVKSGQTGMWTRLENITIWVSVKNHPPPMLHMALHYEVRRCPHRKVGHAVLRTGIGEMKRHFCLRCGKTL